MQAWAWPSGTSKSEVAAQLAEALNSYPQAGQNGVDLGGWKVVEDSLKSAGTAKYEFYSGIGNFAKFFNGGKPFVDDFQIEITPSDVQVFSSSRIGDSDLGVNAKRLNFIATQLRAKGWSAPDVVPK